MVPSGPPTPVGGAQNIPPSLLRTNSGVLGAQGGSAPSQQSAFPTLLSPRSQYNSMNLLGNISNVSSLLNQSFVNGGSNSGVSGSGSLQRGGLDMGAESDSLSGLGSSMGFAPSSTAFVPSNMNDAGPSGQTPGQNFSNPSGNQLVSDQQQQQLQPSQQLESRNFPHGQHQQQPQRAQYQSLRSGLNNLAPVKLEPQMGNDQNGPMAQQQQQQQLQSLRKLASVKLEAQQLQPFRSLGQVKMEPQHSEQSLYLHQQQQQQLLQMSRQNPQTAAILHQQRLLQLQQQQQQQQQQQLLKSLPQQRAQLQNQLQQNLPVRPVMKQVYEPGTCARRLTHYMYHQQHRPPDNNIEFWRKFVAEYFAPHAKKRWCVSLYGSGRQTTGVVPQDVWHCEICNRKPGRGFETTVEVLPRLCKIKYDSGTLEELLYVDMPREYENASGQIVLDYGKAVQESVFEQLRVVREGQLRIVFSSDLKICSWEFCARRHEELIPRRLIVPQVSQVGAVAQKYQSATQSASSNLTAQELQNTCNMFVASARQLAKALEVPLVNDLGYTKRYVRCLQISEVVNSMKDLIDYSHETRTGPMASLINFPRRTGSSSLQQNGQVQQTDGRPATQNSNDDKSSVLAPAQLAASNPVTSVNHSYNATLTSTSANAVATLLHQNSMNSRQENSVNNGNSPYGGNAAQIPSASSSSSLPQTQTKTQTQPNQSSPFPSPTLSASNNNPSQAPNNSLSSPTTTGHLNSANSPANISTQQPSQSMEADRNDSQSSVQQIIQEMMMTSQLNGGSNIMGVGSFGNEMKNVNGITQTSNGALNGGNGLIGNGMVNSSMMNGGGYGTMSATGPSVTVSGVRSVMPNNSLTMNGRLGIPSITQDQAMNHQQQDLGNRLLSNLGAMNSFNNLQYDWKSSP